MHFTPEPLRALFAESVDLQSGHAALTTQSMRFQDLSRVEATPAYISEETLKIISNKRRYSMIAWPDKSLVFTSSILRYD